MLDMIGPDFGGRPDRWAVCAAGAWGSNRFEAASLVCLGPLVAAAVAGAAGPGWPCVANAAGNSSLGSGFTDGISNTILFAEKRAENYSRGNAANGKHQNIWAHGGGNTTWAPIFASGSTDGPTPFDSADTGGTMSESGSGYVGAASLYPGRPEGDAGNGGLAASWHTNGVVTLFADGGVTFLGGSISPAAVWWPLRTPSFGAIPTNS